MSHYHWIPQWGRIVLELGAIACSTEEIPGSCAAHMGAPGSCCSPHWAVRVMVRVSHAPRAARDWEDAKVACGHLILGCEFCAASLGTG